MVPGSQISWHGLFTGLILLGKPYMTGSFRQGFEGHGEGTRCSETAFGSLL